jgi:hypothetical protein
LITITGLKELLAKVQNENRLILQPTTHMLQNDLGDLAQREATSRAPSSVARTIMRDTKPLMVTVRTPMRLAYVFEYGRRPGAPAPPVRALEGWAASHGVPREVLFVVARAIGRRGQKGRFFFKRARDAVERALPGKLQQLSQRIEAIWGRR